MKKQKVPPLVVNSQLSITTVSASSLQSPEGHHPHSSTPSLSHAHTFQDDSCRKTTDHFVPSGEEAAMFINIWPLLREAIILSADDEGERERGTN